MLFVKPVRDRDEPFVPPVVARLVPSDEQDRTALGIESVKHPEGPSGVLDDQFLTCFEPAITPECGRRSAGPKRCRRMTLAFTSSCSSSERWLRHVSNSSVYSTSHSAGDAYVPTVFVEMYATLGWTMSSQHFVHGQDRSVIPEIAGSEDLRCVRTMAAGHSAAVPPR